MESFSHKTSIDLPDIRKRRTYKNKEADDFDLLFTNNKEADLIDLRKNKRFKGHHVYIVIGLALLIAACFLVVQMVVNSPEIEKYKAVTKNIEDIDIEDEKSLKENIPNVQFDNDSVKPVISKKIEITKKLKQKTITKPLRIVVHNLKKNNLKERKLKIQEAIADIMLRPLAVSSEPALRGLSKN